MTPHSQNSKNFKTGADSTANSGRLTLAALTGGLNIPSARFRIRQYKCALETLDIQVEEYASSAGQYPPRKKWKRPLWFLAALIDGVARVSAARDADLVFLQRELISTLTTLERFIRSPIVFDVDDAIWLHKRGRFAGSIAALSDAVICGNNFTADYFRRFNNRVYVIPTAVDTSRFRPSGAFVGRPPIICWSGTSSNLVQLELIETALSNILSKYPTARLRVVSDKKPTLKSISPTAIEFIQWSEEVEVSALNSATIGIMPLEENDWSCGKCAYKMLTYMGCGLPVVVSPVGMNRQLLDEANIGLGASTHQDWYDALSVLIEDPVQAVAMGQSGRKLVEDKYSVDVLAPRIAGVLRETYERRRVQGKGRL